MGRRTIVLVVALLLAGLSAFAVYNYLTSVEDQVKVFRATRLIPQGTPGNQAQSSLAVDNALKDNVVFEGSTILCTGPVNPEKVAPRRLLPEPGQPR